MDLFTNPPQRRQTGSFKWDLCDRIFGGEELLPMWVADMDFPTAPSVVEAIKSRADHGIFGYSALSPRYYQAVMSWMKQRHDWDIEREWIVFTPGVVPALGFAIQAATQPGDEVMVASPVYDPFYRAVEDNGRQLAVTPLRSQDGCYTFDWEDIQRRITPRTKAFLLCSPHNPVGRVWTKQELSQLAEICFSHDMVVIADEIHNDLILPGHQHTTFANAHPEALKRSIICTAPSKTFNLAGLQVANTILAEEGLRQAFRREVGKAHAFAANSFVEAATVAAYEQGGSWLEKLLQVLDENFDFFVEEINHIQGLYCRKAEGTYLAWVDASGLGMEEEALHHFLVQDCGLAFNRGGAYGKEHNLYFRVNLACPKSRVEEAIRRLKAGIAK